MYIFLLFIFCEKAKMRYITNKGVSLIAQGVSKRTSKVYSSTGHNRDKITTN